MTAPDLGRWFATRGWVHLLLIAGAGVFLLPFLWMLSSALKTDEELAGDRWLPTLPVFRAVSPYVRASDEPRAPDAAPLARWHALQPRLQAIARTATSAAAASSATATPGVDEDALAEAAAALACERVAARIPRTTWEAGDDAVVAAFTISGDDARSAIDDRLARIDLSGAQLQNEDGSIAVLTSGAEGAHRWRVESGPGELIATDAGARLCYRFASADAAPIVLRLDAELPADWDAAALHTMTVSLRADDSWHRADADLEIAGTRWRSTRTSWLAQHRIISFLFQPPTADDATYKPKLWSPLIAILSSPGAGDARHATLRLTLTPSSTSRAILGKLARNITRAFAVVPFWTYVGNSVLVSGQNVIGTLLSSALVGYAFARLRWPGRSLALMALLATMMLPSQVTMVPSFLVWRSLGWYNTLNPLWVPAWLGNAFFIYLMIQQMKTIPRELEEAARLDGMNAAQCWWYVIVPQVRPALGAIAIMSFMASWNDFMGPLIMLRDQSRFPLSLGLFSMPLTPGMDWSVIMAGNLLMTLPVIAVFVIFQRAFVHGLTATGLK